MSGKQRPEAAPSRAKALGAAVLIALLVSVAVRFVPVLRLAESWTRDLRLVLLAPAPAGSPQVAVVVVDEEALSRLPYRSPIDRGLLAQMVRTIAAQRPRAIGLDLLFDQPTEPAKDAELRAALRGAGVPVVVATVPALTLRPAQVRYLGRFVEGLGTGRAEVARDRLDDTVRVLPLRETDPTGAGRLGFAAALARAAGHDAALPPQLYLDYRGAEHAFAVFTADALPRLPAGWLRDKVVLIGVDEPSADRHRTPLSLVETTGTTPGVLIHAHGVAQLLAHRPDPRLPGPAGAVVVLLAAVLGLALAHRRRPATAVLGAVAGALVLAAVLLYSYRPSGRLVPVVPPLLAFSLGAITSGGAQWRRARQRATRIGDIFQRYVSPAVVEHLIRADTEPELGGERRETTFLFTDIAGFTTLTEALDPRVLVSVLNRYFDGATRIVFDSGGTIDKFVGDAVHAMFNAPLDQPDHAERGVRCALALDAFFEGFRKQMNAEGVPLGETRIGVNTGRTIVGNIGGELHLDYSATGDAINVASRLEGANKHLGTRLCVSETTASRCPELSFRPVGTLRVVGKSTGLAVFEPLADGQPGRAPLDAYLDAFARLDREPGAALAAFRSLHERFPCDPLAALHAERLCRGEGGSLIVLESK